MIKVYTGTPESCRDFHVAFNIFLNLVSKRTVISNLPVDVERISCNGKRKVGKFIYKDCSELTVNFLYDYADSNAEVISKSQTLLVIDECQAMFNTSEFKGCGLEWSEFFTQHRLWGYNVILSASSACLLDRLVRFCADYEYRHMKYSYKIFRGFLFD